jgi:hypothetical protein
MVMIEAIKKWFNNLFAPKTDWKAKYEEKKMLAEHWEFKYNRLYRELEKLVKENI